MKLCGREIGLDHPFFLIAGPCVAGPCVIESREFAIDTAKRIKEISEEVGLHVIYKSSFDKANRTSVSSFRGPQIDEGLDILAEVRDVTGLPVLTDVHSAEQVEKVAAVVDVLQTPAFLCRQTDLIQAVGSCGKPVNIKKGQFLSPPEMKNVAEKAIEAGGEGNVMVCERGASFGYNNLVVDMRSLSQMRDTNCPVVSGGQREFVPTLAKAAVAVGVSGVFMETHPNPEKALSDGPNAWPLDELASLLTQLKQLDAVSKGLAES